MRARLPRVGRRARRGQAAVLIALVLFVMLLLVAMSTNIGIVVNDKIRMQSTADLSTYAVAYSEAASLNELVDLNKEIVDAVTDCRRTLSTGTIGGMWPETVYCGCQPNSQLAEMAVQACKMNIDSAISRFVSRAQYDRTITPALSAGRATADANFSGVGVSFFDNVYGSPTMRGTYWLRGGFNLAGPVIYMPSLADIRQVDDTLINYQVLAFCPAPPGECVPTPMIKPPEALRTWFYKETRDPDVWVAGRVNGTPEKQFLDTDYSSGGRDRGYFGASSTGGDDEIYAYSVAKPYDGSLGPSELNGNQRNGNMLGARGVYITRGTTYPKLSMYDEYRARLAGLNENLEGSRTPSDIVQEDGWRNGKTWDMDKFRH